MRAIRAAWGQREPRYDGDYYTFEDVVVDPAGVQERLPIWVGGRTDRSLRRALEFGDAWVPFLLAPEDIRSMLDRAAESPAAQARVRTLDVALWPEPALDVLREPGRVREQFDEHVAAGATMLNYRFPSRSLGHHLEQMEALTEILDFSWET